MSADHGTLALRKSIEGGLLTAELQNESLPHFYDINCHISLLLLLRYWRLC